MMLATVRSLDLPPDSIAVDVGCGEGAHAFRLAAHFGLQVLGIDPVQRHLDLAREARRDEPEVVASRVSFERGTRRPDPARATPRSTSSGVATRSRTSPSLASALPRVRPGPAARRPGAGPPGRSPPTCSRPRRPTGCSRCWASCRPRSTWTRPRAAIAHAGLVVDASVDLGSEWGEHEEETSGRASRALLHVARLQRDPERYRAGVRRRGVRRDAGRTASGRST